ncbi:hypothetical protein FQR65_LT01619 [Abscondita terminalis]|nr:hypothetical protein FQR65_LT01619 [Abscondita terminalis]
MIVVSAMEGGYLESFPGIWKLKACGCRKAGLKCFVVCGDSCHHSQFPSQDSSEEEETNNILYQINDEIKNEEDYDESDDPIVDDAEETSVFDISISAEDK